MITLILLVLAVVGFIIAGVVDHRKNKYKEDSGYIYIAIMLAIVGSAIFFLVSLLSASTVTGVHPLVEQYDGVYATLERDEGDTSVLVNYTVDDRIKEAHTSRVFNSERNEIAVLDDGWSLWWGPSLAEYEVYVDQVGVAP